MEVFYGERRRWESLEMRATPVVRVKFVITANLTVSDALEQQYTAIMSVLRTLTHPRVRGGGWHVGLFRTRFQTS